MSPEQLSGDPLDGRSDLYSLALVFYRMLTGKLPFEATTVQETRIKRPPADPAKLAETRPDLSFPNGLEPVLDTALARTPSERYQSVAKFASDVAAVTGRPTSRAAPHTRSGSVDTDSKTQLLDATGGVTQRIGAQRTAAPRKRSLIPVAIGVVVILAGAGAWVALNGGSRTGGDGARLGDSIRVSRDTAATQTTRQTGNVQRSGPQPGPLAPRDTVRRGVGE